MCVNATTSVDLFNPLGGLTMTRYAIEPENAAKCKLCFVLVGMQCDACDLLQLARLEVRT